MGLSPFHSKLRVMKETAFVAIPQWEKKKKEAKLDELKIRFLHSHEEFPCMSLSQTKFNILGDDLWFPLQRRHTGNVASSLKKKNKTEKRSSGWNALSTL